MCYDQEQANPELQTPFDLCFTLTFLLHFYSNAFVALLTSLCIDLAWVVTTITTRLVEWAIESLCDLISEGVRAIRWRLHREVPTSRTRILALVLCLLFLASDLLIDWSTLSGSLFGQLPPPVLQAFALVTPIAVFLAGYLTTPHSRAWEAETAQLLAEVEQLYAETRAEAAQTYRKIERCAGGGEE